MKLEPLKGYELKTAGFYLILKGTVKGYIGDKILRLGEFIDIW